MPGAVLPLVARVPNEVDKLEDRIREIQRACVHDFKLIEEADLAESLVPGVFMGDSGGESKALTLVCTKCSVWERRNVCRSCPRCLGNMREGGLDKDRAKYKGPSLANAFARLRSCESCGFTLVSDEWSQG